MKKRDKKGVSHIGFVIAFVLFVGFIIFLFGILGPIGKVEEDKDFLLNHVKDKIIEESSSELTIVSAKLNSGNCPDMTPLGIVNFILKSEGTFYKIYSSDIFGLNNYGCSSLDYELGLIRSEDYIFEEKILGLINSYNLDYNGFKDSFNIPNVNDFEFGFIYSNGTEIKTLEKEIPSTEVFAELIPITYADKNANRENGYLRIAIW